MSYNALYFYLKLPINYPIFCSEYACRPASVESVSDKSEQQKFVPRIHVEIELNVVKAWDFVQIKLLSGGVATCPDFE